MKRIVLLFVIALVVGSWGSPAAEAQRSGSLQVIARVVDSRDSWAGLQSANELAARWASGLRSAATVGTSLSQVSIALTPASPGTAEGNGDVWPRRAEVTIQFLRN